MDRIETEITTDTMEEDRDTIDITDLTMDTGILRGGIEATTDQAMVEGTTEVDIMEEFGDKA